MEYIKQEGFGGGMTWAIDMDDFRSVCGNENALLKVMNQHLSGHEVIVPITPSPSPTTSTSAPVRPPAEVDCSSNIHYFPHETDCSKYYWCINGEPKLQSCASGTIWDWATNTCNWPQLVNRPECKTKNVLL
jgi:chitinase